ncbi:MAG: hypothetical protein OEX11_09490 [Nitrosomonas sp.]|nr:hypothetical protein [Nitrosomonas sp.]
MVISGDTGLVCYATLKEILESIAGEHKLKPKLGDDFGTIDYGVVNQTNEHDLNLLTRLGGKVGVVAKPASGFLLFVKKVEAKTASGAVIPPISLTPKEVPTGGYTWSSVEPMPA